MSSRVSSCIASVLSVALLSAGCGAPSTDVCGQAAAHLAECGGSEATPSAGSCDALSAQAATEVLGSSCEALASFELDGKSDDPIGTGVCLLLGVPLLVARHGPEGSGCCWDHNCESGLGCRSHVCRPRQAEGGSCVRDGNCVSGLVCYAGSCVQPRQQGERCAEKSDCAAPLTCAPSRTCKPALADGAACTINDQCASTCRGGLCASSSAAGGACDRGDDGDCQSWLNCVGSQCVEASLGSACDPGDDSDCFGASTPGLVCVSGACQPQPQAGEACDRQSTFACPSGQVCWDGVCEGAHAAGAPCERLFDCQMGLFCIDGSCAS